MRYAKKIDNNQNNIVKELRAMGVTVKLDCDDILCGFEGKNYLFELKSKKAVSKKTGLILESAIKDSQKKLRAEWQGQYNIVSSIEEIKEIMGL